MRKTGTGFNTAAIVCLCAIADAQFSFASVIYVDSGAPLAGANNGTSWFNAYRTLPPGLAAAASGDEVRVAAGTYLTAGANRTATFSVSNGVLLNGSFAGWGAPNPDLQDTVLFTSILSGDRSGNDGSGIFTDNSYHVVEIASGATAELRAVTIRAGYADFTPGEDRGGGVSCVGATVTLNRCTIEDNRAADQSGGIEGGVLHMLDCRILRNATVRGRSDVGGVSAAAGSTFTGCVFSQNFTSLAGSFGALLVSNATIDGCFFLSNNGSEDGGAIGGGGLYITDTLFSDNSASFAGAIRTTGALTCERCTFNNNSGGDRGGAVDCFGSSEFIDCQFIGNHARRGGAIRVGGSECRLKRCDFAFNYIPVGVPPESGGAILAGTEFGATNGAVVYAASCRFMGNDSRGSDGGAINFGGQLLTVVNSHFSGNKGINGSAISTRGQALLVNNTITDSNCLTSNGAVYVAAGATCVIHNSILWNNISPLGLTQASQITVLGTANINHSLVMGWTGSLVGVGTSGANPSFIDPDGADNTVGTLDDDPRLSLFSPARDAGDSSALPPDTLDLDEDANVLEPTPRDLLNVSRVRGPAVDIGVIESTCPPDIDGSGTVNVTDLLAVISAWGRCPGPCPPRCAADVAPAGGDCQVNVTDLLAVISAWGSCL